MVRLGGTFSADSKAFLPVGGGSAHCWVLRGHLRLWSWLFFLVRLCWWCPNATCCACLLWVGVALTVSGCGCGGAGLVGCGCVLSVA